MLSLSLSFICWRHRENNWINICFCRSEQKKNEVNSQEYKSNSISNTSYMLNLSYMWLKDSTFSRINHAHNEPMTGCDDDIVTASQFQVHTDVYQNKKWELQFIKLLLELSAEWEIIAWAFTPVFVFNRIVFRFTVNVLFKQKIHSKHVLRRFPLSAVIDT